MREKHKKLKRGYLIVLEGIDGCGKTTQAKRLVDQLQDKGFDTVFFKEPSDGPWGKLIKEKADHRDGLTPEQEFVLFQKDREENVKRNIEPALKKKQVVILDRYYFSTMAYQSAKGIDINEIKRKNEQIAVPPDLVIILDIDARSGLDRIKGRKKKDMLFERENYLREVGKIFRGLSGENIIHLDARDNIEKLFSKIEGIVMGRIEDLIISIP
ncbi:MAG: dTMP kinase [Acidobacteriota bacterium]